MELFKKETVTKKVWADKTEEILVPNWDLIPVGSKFTGNIDGDVVEGRIQKIDNAIYLCQNDRNEGHDIDRLGYKFAWSLGEGNVNDLDQMDVSIKTIELDPEFLKTYTPPPPPFVVAGYEAEFYPGYVQFGCQKVPNELVMEVVSKLIPKE